MMKLLLLSVVSIQLLLSSDKFLSEGNIVALLREKTTDAGNDYNVDVITTHRRVSVENCIAYSKHVQFTALSFSVDTDGDSRDGVCQISSVGSVIPNRVCDDDDQHEHHTVCQSNPCKNQGVCKSNGKNDFQCSCHYPMGGKTCEDLICSSCYRKDDLVIFLNTTIPSTTWSESYEYCSSRGLTLFLDKTREKHDFIDGVLRQVIPDVNRKVAFWIGVNRTSPSSPFKFIDGTPLSASYTPWSPGRPDRNLCVEIANTPAFDWKWDDESCETNYPGWAYYPLCEKTYSFLSRNDGPLS